MKTWELSLPEVSTGTVLPPIDVQIWGSNGVNAWGYGSKGAIKSKQFNQSTGKLTLTSDNDGGANDYYGIMVRYEVLVNEGGTIRTLNHVHSTRVSIP